MADVLPGTATSGATVTIEGKQFGRGRVLFPTWQMTVPEGTMTLREFITRVVEHEVAAYRERQEQRQTIRALTAAQIAEGVERGKIDAGGREEKAGEADVDTAVKAAIQGFEDGLYYVFVNEVQQEKLDAPVTLREGSPVLFMRLVALAGG